MQLEAPIFQEFVNINHSYFLIVMRDGTAVTISFISLSLALSEAEMYRDCGQAATVVVYY